MILKTFYKFYFCFCSFFAQIFPILLTFLWSFWVNIFRYTVCHFYRWIYFLLWIFLIYCFSIFSVFVCFVLVFCFKDSYCLYVGSLLSVFNICHLLSNTFYLFIIFSFKTFFFSPSIYFKVLFDVFIHSFVLFLSV